MNKDKARLELLKKWPYILLALVIILQVFLLVVYWTRLVLWHNSDKLKSVFLCEIASLEGESQRIHFIYEKMELKPGLEINRPKIYIWTGLYWKLSKPPKGQIMEFIISREGENYLAIAADISPIDNERKFKLLVVSNNKLAVSETILLSDYGEELITIPFKDISDK